MAIKSLTLVSFRNHKKQVFRFQDGLTVIWGENGSGKTAALEAIHFLSFGSSFRTRIHRDLIRNSDGALSIRGEFVSKNYSDSITIYVEKKSGQKIKLNDKQLSGRKELLGRNNVVVLSPEEQPVTKGAPAERRQFFDKMFSITSKSYMETLQSYSRIIKQRASILFQLKENRRLIGELESWDEQLVNTGQKLWSFRFDLIDDFKEHLIKILNQYDGGIKLDLKYTIDVPTVEAYQSKIQETQSADITRGRTSYGPHRDDISLSWNGRDLRRLGSQGEHKLSLVLLKLAEMEFVRNKTGTHPTLLLDDLFAKLDLERSKKIVSLLQGLEFDSGRPVQTIVTTTDILNVEKSGLLTKEKETKTYHLER
ncbi:MAG: DNA replication and repair protein RecF [Candidatus Marinimicrobia bacterium]|jgi:DNA replication and repair protein RecF|nr:DNA replication and repair protein RecF [Candidatus Neomarinimicrobiota bacterium]MBT3840285.1 DNA replication and repair protein RecF [Candidatus Neomarinimicrobiota bacterium]MBT4000283.1 DNA replication and repair protein RecF [Candidatus Neomarinimicrobiota bacterium]MBT4382627.1 DNA replication and repair protein RecF [Candidatus Neomarinimicrobiota bacterium]MBT4578490.1 DNA replication and repair protein RecF [Candidatus Neomarinimicrobiota bacterium]